MRPQPAKHYCPGHQGATGDPPEPESHAPVLPEPHSVDKALPVSLDDVEGRIELEQEVVGRGEYFQVPENRREIKTHLQDDGDQRAQILEENNYRRGDPGDTDQQDNGAEKVVENLDHMDIKAVAIGKEHDEDEIDEKTVNNKSREDLDEREDADAEGDLLDDKCITDNGTGAVGDAVVKEKPGEHAADQPEYVGVACYRLGVEADLEDKPEDRRHGEGEKKGPEDTEVGTEVAGLEIPPGQLDDDILLFGKFLEEGEKHPDAVHKHL